MTSDRNALRAVLRDRFPRDHGQLLPALHFLQHEFGYLPDWAMEVVGWHLGIPASEVYGAATSYSELRMSEPDAHVVKVCTGLGCRVNGGLELLERVRREIASDNTTQLDVEEVPCGYICALAPVAKWGHDWIGRATIEDLTAIAAEAMSE